MVKQHNYFAVYTVNTEKKKGKLTRYFYADDNAAAFKKAVGKTEEGEKFHRVGRLK